MGCDIKRGHIALVTLISVDNVDVKQCLQMSRIVLLASGSPGDFAKMHIPANSSYESKCVNHRYRAQQGRA